MAKDETAGEPIADFAKLFHFATLADAQAAIASGNLPDPDEILARMTPDKRRAALWQRRDVVKIFSAEYRAELLRGYVIDGGKK